VGDVQQRTIELADGTQLWAEARGTGPAVLCCHGGPGLWDYLSPLAQLLENEFRVIRFDQRGCGRSTGRDGPFTVTQALDDVDDVCAAFEVEHCAVVGHSWGAELALRYAARRPGRVTAVGYVAGVGAGNAFHDGYAAERDRRLGADLGRWRELGSRVRTADEEHEWCVLQWRPDFSPDGDTHAHAEQLWATRPAGARVNARANRELWADRATDDLLEVARQVVAPVTMLLGADDPRPWRATDSLVDALPRVRREVVADAGHAPWVERAEVVRGLLVLGLAGVR